MDNFSTGSGGLHVGFTFAAYPKRQVIEQMMTVLKKMNWAAAVTTRAVRHASPARTGSRIQRLFIAAERRLDYDLLDEIGAWGLFAGVSLTGWLAAAIAFGFI